MSTLAPTRFHVTVSPEARDQIEQELYRHRFILSESETGGLLFGDVSGDSVHITVATGPGPTSARRPTPSTLIRGRCWATRHAPSATW